MRKEIAADFWQPSLLQSPFTTYRSISNLIFLNFLFLFCCYISISLLSLSSMCGASFCGLQTRNYSVFSASLTSILPLNTAVTASYSQEVAAANIHRNKIQEQSPFGKWN